MVVIYGGCRLELAGTGMSRRDDYRFLSVALSLGTFSVSDLARAADAPTDTAKTWLRRERERQPSRLEPAGSEHRTDRRHGRKANRWRLTSTAQEQVRADLGTLYSAAILEVTEVSGASIAKPTLPDLEVAETLMNERTRLEDACTYEDHRARITTRISFALDEARDLDAAGVALPAEIGQRLGRACVECGLVLRPPSFRSLHEWQDWILEALERLSGADIPSGLLPPFIHGVFSAGPSAGHLTQKLWFPLACIAAFGTLANLQEIDEKRQRLAEALVTYVTTEWRLVDLLMDFLNQTPSSAELKSIVSALPYHSRLATYDAGLWTLFLAVTGHWDNNFADVVRHLLINQPGTALPLLNNILNTASNQPGTALPLLNNKPDAAHNQLGVPLSTAWSAWLALRNGPGINLNK